MPDLSPLLGAFVVVVVVVFMGWFALGTQRNIRLGNDVLRWLQDGLPLLGRRTTMRWLGSSAVELRIADAAVPFREATVLVVLEPRDIGIMWAWARLRGRRDFVIIRADLRTAPRVGVDAWDPEGWTGRPSPEGIDWEPVDWPIAGVEARASAGSDPAPVRTAWQALRSVTPAVWRISVQPVVPHLEVHLRAPNRDVPARRLLEPVRDLGRALAERR
jgi:hypothetical protein